jgi:8-oxo-dGTP diphosphatase
MEYSYKYPRPALTVDAIVVASNEEEKMLLLIQRKGDPFKGKWALPGGFVDLHETLKEAAMRELKEETGVDGIDLQQFYVFDAVERDPRERTISVVHYGFIDEILPVKGNDDAQEARWFPIHNLPELAFDHDKVVERFLREKMGTMKL